MKTFLLLISTLLCSISLYSQVDSTKLDPLNTDSTKKALVIPLEATKYIPPSPTAAAFARYGDIPVSYHTGLVNQDIPLYTFTSRELSLPISLSYHFSGNKVEDVSSWVGLGFSLNAGGVISRSVQGTPDEGQGSPYSTGYYARSVAGSYFSQGGNQYAIPRPLNYPSANCTTSFSQDFQNALNGEHDTEPDIFFFNVAGYSGKFVFDSLAVAHLIPEQDIKIEAIFSGNGSTGTFNQFVLTTPDGTQYYFGGTHGNSSFPMGDIAIEKTHTDATNPVASSWYLTKIVSADQQSKIYLSYLSENYAYFDLMQESIDYQNGWQGGFSPSQNFTKYRFQGIRLTNIYSSDGNTQANFIANTLRLDVGEYNSGEVNAGSQAKYLNEIQILNRSAGFKKFVFTHDYFQASSGNIINSFKPLTLQNNPTFYQADLKRLRLLTVQEKSWDNTLVVPPYQFEYENTISFPRRLCFSRDHWGYYNGNEYIGSGVNNSLMHIENGDGITGVPSALVSGLGWQSNRSTNPAYSGFGALNKIIYPTGGYTVFEMESNQRGSYAPSLNIGGLRVKSISNFDTDGTRLTKKAFDYLISGILYAKPTYYYTAQTLSYPCGTSNSCYPSNCPTSIVSSATLLPLNNSQGHHIGYREVKVSEIDNLNVASNGYKLFTYNTDPPITETFYPGSTDDYGAVRLYNYPVNPLRPNYRQGSLALEETITTSNILIEKISYDYQASLKVLKIPSLKVDNHTVANISGGAKYYNVYTFKTGRSELKSKTTTKCQQDGTGCVISTENYEYGSSKHFQMTRKSIPMSYGDSLISSYKYSFDYNLNIGTSSFDAASNGIKALQTKHKLVPIEEVDMHKNTGGNVVVISSKLNKYEPTFLKPSATSFLEITNPFLPLASFVPSAISNIAGQAVFGFDAHYPINADIAFSYNVFGNIAQIEQPQNSGIISSFLWGYGGSYPIAEVKNAGIATLQSTLTPSVINNLEASNNLTDIQIKTALAPLYGISNSLSTVFTFAPNLGMTSMKAPNELNASYEYDKLGRLMLSKDHENNILAENSYLYASPNQINGKKYRTSSQNVLNTSYLDYITNHTFLDGLGRQIQQVGKQQSPFATDIILSNPVYDALGRVHKSLLPFPTSGSSGSFLANGLSLAQTFYGDTAPLDSMAFELSPLSRVSESFGPGQAWRSSTSSPSSDKRTQVFYESAGTDIRYYYANNANSVILNGTYPANSLFKKRIVDEQGNTIIEITDKQGRLIQSQTQKDNAGNWLTTYYCYDGLGRPRAIIQPMAYNLNQTINATDQAHRDFVFAYEYDSRGRLIREDIPGAGERYSVYDKRDRLVMQKDALQSEIGKWNFWRYDAFDREVMRGETGPIGYTQSYWQYYFNQQTVINEAWDYNTHYFTNTSFPSNTAIDYSHVKQYQIYDDYDFAASEHAFKADSAYHPRYTNAKGLLTLTVKRDLNLMDQGQYRYYIDTYYYDNKNRPIQIFSTHDMGGANNTTKYNLKNFQYNFAGEVVKERIYGQFTSGNISLLTEFDRNHVGLVTNTYLTLNGGIKEKISTQTYDAINRLLQKTILPDGTFTAGGFQDYINRSTSPASAMDDIAKKAICLLPGVLIGGSNIPYSATINPNGAGGTTIIGLQKMDYIYHIRGGLRGINLDANLNPTPNPAQGDLFSYKLDYETAPSPQWNGNIGKQSWKANDELRSYSFNYDHSSRLKSASFVGIGSENYSMPNINYDDNGNITNLQRNGLLGTNSYGLMDNLSYTYSGNRLNSVTDAISGNHEVDFVPRGNNAYTYYSNGNLKSDANEQISNIEYNTFLNQPKLLTLTDGRTISTAYDGGGNLQKTSYSNGETWQYVDRFVFKNGALFSINIPDGRLLKNANGVWEKEFNYTDHLGNSRVSFKAENGSLVQSAKTDFDPWGVILKSSQTNSIQNRFEMQGHEKDLTFGLNRVNFGARTANPTIGRFDRVDRYSAKYSDLSPYQLSSNNPINRIDPDGNSDYDVILKGKEAQAAFAQLQASVQKDLTLSMDANGKVSYTQNGTGNISKNSQQLTNAIDDHSIVVNVNAENTTATQSGNLYVGGAFSGNTVTQGANGNTVVAEQEINPQVLGTMSTAHGKSGADVLHEVTEAYQGGLISQKSGISSPASNNSNSAYPKAHNRATSQSGQVFETLYDASNNVLQMNPNGSYPIGLKKVEWYVNDKKGNPVIIQTLK